MLSIFVTIAPPVACNAAGLFTSAISWFRSALTWLLTLPGEAAGDTGKYARRRSTRYARSTESLHKCRKNVLTHSKCSLIVSKEDGEIAHTRLLLTLLRSLG